MYFPNWASQFGWKAIGARTDKLAGRTAVTVYYKWKAVTIAYTIVHSPPLAKPSAKATDWTAPSCARSSRTAARW